MHIKENQNKKEIFWQHKIPRETSMLPGFTSSNIWEVASYSYSKIVKSEQINVREHRRGNQEWTIQRKYQYWVHKTQNEDKQNKNHNTISDGHHYT